MTLYATADAALYRYLALRSSLGQLHGQDMSFGAGWADRCARSACATLGQRIDRGGESRCSRCGDLWPYRPPGTTRGPRARETRSGVGVARRLHARYAELALLGIVIATRPGGTRKDAAAVWTMSAERWQRHLTLWISYLTEPGGYIALLERAGEAILQCGYPRSDLGACGVIRAAREVVEARLEARLLLAPRMGGRWNESAACR